MFDLDLDTDEEIILVTENDEGDDGDESKPSLSEEEGEGEAQPIIDVNQCICLGCIHLSECFFCGERPCSCEGDNE